MQTPDYLARYTFLSSLSHSGARDTHMCERRRVALSSGTPRLSVVLRVTVV